jgi:hypothetical protein
MKIIVPSTLDVGRSVITRNACVSRLDDSTGRLTRPNFLRLTLHELQGIDWAFLMQTSAHSILLEFNHDPCTSLPQPQSSGISREAYFRFLGRSCLLALARFVEVE